MTGEALLFFMSLALTLPLLLDVARSLRVGLFTAMDRLLLIVLWAGAPGHRPRIVTPAVSAGCVPAARASVDCALKPFHPRPRATLRTWIGCGWTDSPGRTCLA